MSNKNNNIKLIFEDVNRLEKFIFCMANISELTVLVKVSIDSLNDFSNPILSTTNKLDRMNKLKKNEINIRKDIILKKLLYEHREYINTNDESQPTGANFNLPGHRLVNLQATVIGQVQVNAESQQFRWDWISI